jgi:hypothetical protein
MEEKLPCRRYCAQVYGGQQFIKMRRNISRTVMSIRELENPTGGMRCPKTQSNSSGI